MDKKAAGIWAVSIGIAFYAGYSTKQPQVKVSENESQIVIKASNPSTTQDSYSKGRVNKNRLRVAPGQKARTPVNTVMEEVKALLGRDRIGMHIGALIEPYNLVKNLTEEELLEALELMQADANNPENIDQLELLLGAYAEYDPINAILYFENNITSNKAKMPILNSILSTWSQHNPEEAFEWFLKQDDRNGYHGALLIFKGLAKQDSESAIEKLKELNLSDGVEGYMAVRGIASSLKEKEEFINFFVKTKELDNENLEKRVLKNWVSRSPKDAVEWLDSQEESDELKKYNYAALSEWISINPHDASAWYLKKAEDRQKASEEVARTWSWRDPEEAMKWVQNQENIDSEKLTQQVLEGNIYRNPDFVAKNIDKLKSRELKISLLSSIYHDIASNSNTSKADEYFSSSPYKDELIKAYNERNNIFQSLAVTLPDI